MSCVSLSIASATPPTKINGITYLLQKSPKSKAFTAHVDKLRVCHGTEEEQVVTPVEPRLDSLPMVASETWDMPRRVQPPRAARRPARYQ